MKLRYKINLLALGTMTLVALGITLAAVATINRLTDDLNLRLMRSELTKITDKINDLERVLFESGVGGVSSYVRQAQQEIVAQFAHYTLGETGRLSILSTDGRTVLQEGVPFGAPSPWPFLPELLAQGSGVQRHTYEGRELFFLFAPHSNWNWLLVLSMGTEEMFAQRNAFLTRALLILCVSVFGGAILFLGFAHRIVTPIQRLSRAAGAISKGEWEQSLPAVRSGDEVGELTRAFAEMTAERHRAEEELAALNRDLERKVEERTRDLEVKAHELERANNILLALDEAKSAFLSSVSHELRTPLTAIIGFTSLIDRDFSKHVLPELQQPTTQERARRIRENLGIIRAEGERVTRLINEYLDLVKIESGRMTWNDVRMDPAPLVRTAAELAQGLLLQKPEVRLDTTNVPERLPELVVDPDRLLQVLSNLLSNAVKNTPGGVITLSAMQLRERLLICVRDTGSGIPPQDLDRIFDKFHQVSPGDTVTEHNKGTGLGLSICREIVSHYGGAITVESEPGQGSTFCVELPLPGPDQS